MQHIKAIETQYNGYLFRSRLEARWAVFFDAMGIKYDYEPEGFELEDGSRYLPDFFLPKFHYGGIFTEVKPPGDPFLRTRKFSQYLSHPILLLPGPPNLLIYELIIQRPGICSFPVCFDADENLGQLFHFPLEFTIGQELNEPSWADTQAYVSIHKSRQARFDT